MAAVNGASGDVGVIAVRDAQLQFPVEEGRYATGGSAPLVVTIVNNGTELDRLTSVTSTATGEAELSGDVELEPTTSIVAETAENAPGSSSARPTTTSAPSSASAPSSGQPSSGQSSASSASSAPQSAASQSSQPSAAPSSGRPSSAPEATAEPGEVRIVLPDFKQDVRPGQTIKVTFRFEKAGQLTLDVPIGATPEARVEQKSEH
ncbi:hypothetical protein Amir_0365 [Actinosynnema mirum DSM 43827]|uniref:Copper chaperone PCu(A)C n=1 Tax=Actinosynnema mirum (strain ATCC 29888 / DSM 43827 / JCM 3225 / NBRC 14064 / NCIMB 13271 / NRRL B-12336 / IMRU 3971 / 101) TaxID=446462 RepID=C6WGL8_ACTMD|nr:hypothetical protein Amir_0365 [Actinosynnema mirum DSM 43827]